MARFPIPAARCTAGRCVLALAASCAALAIVAGAAPAAATTPRHAHIYVSDPFGNAVRRYVLVDGVPASSPDAVIPARRPLGIALDWNNDVYVAESESGMIHVYRPSPHGMIRVHSLHLGYEPTYLAVDRGGYLFVSRENGDIQVYSSGFAWGRSLGRIPVPETQGLATDSAGRLYVLVTAAGIWTYDHPEAAPKRPDGFVKPTSSEHVFTGALAVDEHDELFARFIPLLSGAWTQMDFADVTGPPRIAPPLLTQDCHSGREPGYTYGAAAGYGHLYVGCNTPGPAVYVYAEHAGGRRTALARISRELSSVAMIALDRATSSTPWAFVRDR